MPGWLVPAIKLVILVGLATFVLSTVQLQDAIELKQPGADGAVTVTGTFVGDYRERTGLRFIADSGPEAGTERAVPEAALVKPGLTTYWKHIELSWFLLGALCYFISATFAATRWWWLLRANQLGVSYGQAFRFTWIGIFFNNVVPGGTGGDLVKAIYVMKRCEGARVPAMMSVVVDRIMGLGSLSLLAAVAVLFYLDNEEFQLLAQVLWAILGGVVLIGCLAFSKRLRSLIRLKPLLERLPERLSGLLKRVDHAVYFYRGHKLGMGLWLLGGVFNHVASVLSYAFIGISLSVGLPLQDYFVLIPVIVIASALPIAPNGWGWGEYLFQYLFGKLGATHLEASMGLQQASLTMGTRGVALSILHRIHMSAWSLLGGLMYFFGRDKVTRKEMAEEVEQEEVEEAQFDVEMVAQEQDEERAKER